MAKFYDEYAIVPVNIYNKYLRLFNDDFDINDKKILELVLDDTLSKQNRIEEMNKIINEQNSDTNNGYLNNCFNNSNKDNTEMDNFTPKNIIKDPIETNQQEPQEDKFSNNNKPVNSSILDSSRAIKRDKLLKEIRERNSHKTVSIDNSDQEEAAENQDKTGINYNKRKIPPMKESKSESVPMRSMPDRKKKKPINWKSL